MSTHFRLQKLLELRERQVEECERALAVATGNVRAAEERHQECEEETVRLSNSWKETMARGVTAWQTVDFELAAQRQVHELAKRADQLAQMRERVLAARVNLEQARNLLKALEKSRERFLARVRIEEQRREQAAMDELANKMGSESLA